jgi:hypothetical protein
MFDELVAAFHITERINEKPNGVSTEQRMTG